MSRTFEQIAQEAVNLPPRQRLMLAGFLLEMEEAGNDPDVEAAWEAEISDRIKAIEDGREVGVSFEDVMRESERLLQP